MSASTSVAHHPAVRSASPRTRWALRSQPLRPGVTLHVTAGGRMRVHFVVADSRGKLLSAAAVEAGEVVGGVMSALNEPLERLHTLLERGLAANRLAELVSDGARRRGDVAAFVRRVEESAASAALWPASRVGGALGFELMSATDSLSLDVVGFARGPAVSVWSGHDSEGVACAAVCVSRSGARVSPWVRFSEAREAASTAEMLLAMVEAGCPASETADTLVQGRVAVQARAARCWEIGR